MRKRGSFALLAEALGPRRRFWAEMLAPVVDGVSSSSLPRELRATISWELKHDDGEERAESLSVGRPLVTAVASGRAVGSGESVTEAGVSGEDRDAKGGLVPESFPSE